MASVAGGNSRNQILMRLNREDYDRLRPHVEAVSLSLKQPIYAPRRQIQYVYFPESGVISIVKEMDDGSAIEIGTVGNEGMVGLPVVFGIESTSFRAFCQVPGRAFRLRAETVLAERKRGGQFAELLMRFANATMTMLAQSVACNRVHTLDQRMCRWLLMTHDRVGANSFPLTQEFLAQMLGVRRPTANRAGTSLQRAGLIRYTRGKITISDRKGLEEASCECYFQIRDEFARSLGTISKEGKNRR